MVDTGRQVRYDTIKDEYVVSGAAKDYVFTRRTKVDGTKSRFYTHDFALVATINENLRRYTPREVKQIDKAEQMMQRLGHMTSAATIGIINSGVQNCPVTASDVRNKDVAKGVSTAGLLGKTKKTKSISPGYALVPRVNQVQQILSIDIVFVKRVAFLLGVLTPLGLGLVEFLRDRSVDSVETAAKIMLAKAASRSFDVLEIRCDGEKAVGALTVALEHRGLRVSIAGPGQHVSVVERMAQTVKSRFRCHELSLPFVMTHTLLVCCMKFCMSCVNLQPSTTSVDKVSPFEQFSGMKLDAKRDLRVAFGDYVLATPANTDNSMLPRAEPCIALGGKFNHTGSVLMLSLRTNKIVTRDQFVIQPMPDIVINKITELATRQGYTRGADPTLEFPHVLEEDVDEGTLPDMMEIDGRLDKHEELDNVDAAAELATSAGMDMPLDVHVKGPVAAQPIPELISPHPIDGPAVEPIVSENPIRRGVRWSQRLSARAISEVLHVRAKATLIRQRIDATRAKMRRELVMRSDCKDAQDYAFKISVRAALRDREDEARPVIMAELKQMVDKKCGMGCT